MNVEPIAAFEDNYIWLLTRPGQACCAVVDPGDAAPVLAVLAARGLSLEAILITHRHADHIGGIPALKSRWSDAIVYGPAKEPIQGLDRRLLGGDQVRLQGLDASFEVLDVPGHTEGHIAYYGEAALFCGDTLFAAGCGRVFTGTFEQLSDSLQRLAKLPVATQVYCAHEYTLANLGFAAWVEPASQPLAARTREAGQRRALGEPTLPSDIGMELATNPFMRTDQAVVVAAAEAWSGRSLHGRAEVFRALRTWKDKDYD